MRNYQTIEHQAKRNERLTINYERVMPAHARTCNLTYSFFHFSENIPLSHIADDMDWPYLHYAQFTPKGHSLVMVYNYDIYYRLGPRTYQSYRVTEDAIPGIIYNGIPDWLYEGKFVIYFEFVRRLLYGPEN